MRERGRRPVARLVVGVAAAVSALTACAGGDQGTAPAAAITTVGASTAAAVVAGDIAVSDAFMPQPASPTVASIYLRIDNHGAGDDALLAASSPVAASVTLHQTVETGDGAGTMRPLDEVPVPAGGSAVFGVGGKHLMVDDPTERLVEGDLVTVVLQFRLAGAMTLHVPVTAIGTQDDMRGMDMSDSDGGDGHDHT